eukprot:CAMPEP_0177497970 /NCGR_PEP_ID=MMETSP0369-20130122/35330_1 /TAXON_ID=447022 ORGANISM="Scrippsiella hangoei-like, Strain SHHI-4" /NCGR_SAMPLE_ID=MMETSP0369 /ASSEMBLY_ACC=CAM_ASM_000364 /LENGTH=109 /DNA_ID=CAMNT_0018975155 /DNA_START=200 /DNA_END=526 /DNA_ORIENTATION=+
MESAEEAKDSSDSEVFSEPGVCPMVDSRCDPVAAGTLAQERHPGGAGAQQTRDSWASSTCRTAYGPDDSDLWSGSQWVYLHLDGWQETRQRMEALATSHLLLLLLLLLL